MCGHVGIAGKLEHKDEATMKRLLIFDFFRGPDSTGLASYRTNGEVHIAKIASHPIDLFDTGRFTKTLSGHASSVFLGHNRLATKGKVNTLNAHPYQYGHIIGAHNGTLDTSSWKALEEIIGFTTDVDSQAIFAAIEKVGIEETVKHMQGAWALVWVDTNENTLNFLRNKQRPFWLAFDSKFERIFWASEHPMIAAATSMSSQPYDMHTSKDGYRFWSTEEDQWYRIKLDVLRAGSKTKPNYIHKKLEGKEAPPVAAAVGASPFPRQTHNNVTTFGKDTTKKDTSTNSTTTSHSHSNNRSTTVIQMIGSPMSPLAGYIKRDKFDELAKYGCSWCQADVEWGDEGITIYESQDKILCAECSASEQDCRIYSTYSAVNQ